MKKNRLCLAFLAFLLTGYAWASTPSVQLKSERHRTEWNWVEYRLSLKNLSDKPLKNPTIRYFAENPKIQFCRKNPKDASCSGAKFGDYEIDSTLRAEVDYFSTVKSVKPTFQYGSQYTVIELKFSGSIPAQKKSSVNFRIMKKNYPAWDCAHDYSFQKNAAVQEKNYMMAVYDADGNLLWGNDPVALKRDTANVYWNDRSGTTVVSQYDGSDSAKTFDGRFWMLEGNSLSYEERKALDSVGVHILETTRYENKDLHLLKAVKAVTKKTLSKVISGFYNAFKVDDTTPLSLALSSDDIYEETQACDANGSCSNVVTERAAFDMNIGCWPDVSMSGCKDVVLSCGGKEVYYDRYVVSAMVDKDSIQCLERHKDIRIIALNKEMAVDNNDGRSLINIDQLQKDTWSVSFLTDPVTNDWLKNASYTGEGVVVGVYDTGIDFTHPAFNEIGSDGKEKARKASGYDDTRTVAKKSLTNGHGTHVAGIIGGNGRESTNKMYRGVAPKVTYLSYPSKPFFKKERGNVTSHSHVIWESYFVLGGKRYETSYYGDGTASIDQIIFKDYKQDSETADKLTKTTVGSAGNCGSYDLELLYEQAAQCGRQEGYHSLTNHSKNVLLVGSIDTDYLNHKLSYFSSLGPTWDGRIKPDVVAPGRSIISTYPKDLPDVGAYYTRMSGTSMSTPFVTGIVSLMYQKFQKQTGISLDKLSMRNSTTKALLIHTAVDLNRYADDNGGANPNPDIGVRTPLFDGPDYASGWGLVDAKAALNMIDGFDKTRKEFKKFREITVYPRLESRWSVEVPKGQSNLRMTLVWDDAPGNTDYKHFTESKLINDLDLYLISPSGEIYYPWRLDTLSVQNVDEKGDEIRDGTLKGRKYGLEKISVGDVKPAYNNCSPINPKTLFDGCFDRRNNVEVVDVKNPDEGTWQVVVKGYRVSTGNSSDGIAQVASLVSDYELKAPFKEGGVVTPIVDVQAPQLIDLGDGSLEHYVFFGPETQIDEGDHIYLFDGLYRLIGDYTKDNPLANQRVVVSTRFLQIVPARGSTTSMGPKYSITGLINVPYGVLQVLFPPYKKK